MENEITSGEIAFREGQKEGEAARDKALQQSATQEKELERDPSLTSAERAAFSVAWAFSAIVLVGLVALTIVGFIFSPITSTLLFAALALGTGLVSYVIWRGGQRVKGTS